MVMELRLVGNVSDHVSELVALQGMRGGTDVSDIFKVGSSEIVQGLVESFNTGRNAARRRGLSTCERRRRQ